MAKRTGLGKGLGAIFGEEVVESREETRKRVKNTENEIEKSSDKSKKTEDETEGSTEVLIKISKIEPNREQPRKDFNPEAIGELADSIRQYGVLQPLLVQKKDDYYEIIAGERRWRAAKEAGLKEVPVVIREYSKQQTMEIALIENVQREDLNPVEEALAYRQLMEEFTLTQEEIAARVSKNRATITNSLRLLKLDNRILEMLSQGQLSGGHARALLSIEDGEVQYETALKIIKNKLSVRDVEKLVKLLGKPKKVKPKEEEERDISFIFRDLEERMKQVMGTKVNINKKDRNKGRIEIEYYSEAELERLVELIESIR